MADLRERLIEIARYEIDKGLTGGTDEDVEVAERIVERFFTAVSKERESFDSLHAQEGEGRVTDPQNDIPPCSVNRAGHSPSWFDNGETCSLCGLPGTGETVERMARALVPTVQRPSHHDYAAAERALAALGLDDLDAATERAERRLSARFPGLDYIHVDSRRNVMRECLRAALTPLEDAHTSPTHDPEGLLRKVKDA